MGPVCDCIAYLSPLSCSGLSVCVLGPPEDANREIRLGTFLAASSVDPVTLGTEQPSLTRRVLSSPSPLPGSPVGDRPVG